LHEGLRRCLSVPREIGGSRHRLTDTVEAEPIAPRSTLAERIDGREDDVWLDLCRRCVVDTHALECLRREVGNHYVRCCDQLPDDSLTSRLGRIEGEAPFVAVDREKQSSWIAVCEGYQPAVLAAVDLLDSYDICSEVRKQGSEIRACDVAAEVEDADAVEYTRGLSVTASAPS